MKRSTSTTWALVWVSVTSMLETILLIMIPHFDILLTKKKATLSIFPAILHPILIFIETIIDTWIICKLIKFNKEPAHNRPPIFNPKTIVLKETINSLVLDLAVRSVQHVVSFILVLNYKYYSPPNTLSFLGSIYDLLCPSLLVCYTLILAKPTHQVKGVKSNFFSIASWANTATVAFSFCLKHLIGVHSYLKELLLKNQGTQFVTNKKLESGLVVAVSFCWGLGLIVYWTTWTCYMFDPRDLNLGDLENGDLPVNDIQNQNEPRVDNQDVELEEVDEPGNMVPDDNLQINDRPPVENPREDIQLQQLIQAGQGEGHHQEDDNSDQDHEAQTIGEGIERVGGTDNITPEHLPQPEPNNDENNNQNIATGSTRSTSSSDSRAIQRRQTHSSKQSSNHDERLGTLFD